MTAHTFGRSLFAAVASVLLAGPALAAFEPVGLHLTWQRDPTTTMTVDWHLSPEQHADEQRRAIAWRELGAEPWQRRDGERHAFPHSDRIIKRVELTGLAPGTTYEFRFGDEARVYRLRTMPAENTEPVRFITGGDTRTRGQWLEQTNSQAMRYDPDFIVWGGDLAYADGRAENVDNWHEWFDINKATLIADDGRVVPVIVAMGNHEMVGGFFYNHDDHEPTAAWRESVAPYFYRLFAFPDHPGYGVLDFGNYLSLFVLDSDHTNPIEGEQTDWLAQALAERGDVTHLIPVYHTPAFPSHRSYGSIYSQRVLHEWVPLFERYGVRIALENHDHTYKRTHPISNARVVPPDERQDDVDYHWVAGGIHSMLGEIDPVNGIVYVGDGCWGVGAREILNTPENTWYMAKAKSARHFIIVTLHNAHQHLLMVDEDGRIIDEYPRTPWYELREQVRP